MAMDDVTPRKRKADEAVDTEEAPTCLHDVSYPDGYVVSEKARNIPSKPAKEFSFKLDPFQSTAISCLERGESVLVSAHTSAGKTVVALYAIAMSLRDKQRVIYTSPIKALSNQKFREFTEQFSDVGLMTGDVTISPSASCLVMTTEILRSMQYKGSEVIREAAWIIFDEVHYMRDRERGVVWEESIVMAPKNSHFVFLSATVPNAKEFADWVVKVHNQPCNIIYTDFRPTPLQHYLFPSGGDGLYLVVDEKGTFREDSFQKAVNSVVVATDNGNKKNGKLPKGFQLVKTGEESDIFKIVKMIMQRQYDPVIIFSFSKRDCEILAMQMSKMDLNADDEKKLVDTIFWSAMDILSDDDKKLPQVSHILPLLQRGIGVHHSGLLPILKEVIEILFQEGLIKCLFATETFSIGLNMPAKTVVFTNVRKFDGDKFRWISSGEYIQMSGRAGRRGLDQRGICILMIDEKMEPSVAKSMVKGNADPLNSAFHLSYNMLLNQLRCEDGDPEALLRQSFYQFQADRSLPSLQKRIKNLEEERDSILIDEEDKLKDYCSLVEQYQSYKRDIRKIVFSPKYCLPFLQPGRLVRILCPKKENGKQPFSEEEQLAWGVVVNFERMDASGDDNPGRPEDYKYSVHVLTKCATSKDQNPRSVAHLLPWEEPGEPLVISVPLSQVDALCAIRLYIPKDLLSPEARENTLKKVQEVLRRFSNSVELLDPEDDMKVESSSYKKATRRIETLENLIKNHVVSKSPILKQCLKAFEKKRELTKMIRSVRKEVRASTSLAFKEELKARKRVLRRLGYITSDDVVELKGKVACELSSADELTLTELVFSGIFKEITIEQMTALLSCFVWQEKLKEKKRLREDLDNLLSQLHDIARRIGKVQLECKVQIDVEAYVNSFHPDIMEAVYQWTRGAKFFQIMQITEVFEGSLIRAIRRLEEVLQQLILASKSIGEVELEGKFQEAVLRIKRDIVFAASLYL